MTRQFQVGEQVRIAARFPPGHVRTPFYVRGKVARVEHVLDELVNPEVEAYGVLEGHRTRLYRVRIAMSALWSNYVGAAGDSLDLEIFEPWLEAADEGER